MRCCLILVFVFAALSPAYTAERCYTSELNPSTTITDDGTNYGRTLVKNVEGKTIVMSTMSGGTGMRVRVAMEEGGKTHTYRYVGDTLIMDMTAYELGCPGGHSWIDRECSRVLISQVDAYARAALFYFLDREHPITSCKLPAPFKVGEVVDVQCDSGQTMRVDASDYPALTVDGVEMVPYDQALPCPFSKKSP